jgi:hypothetical protein
LPERFSRRSGSAICPFPGCNNHRSDFLARSAERKYGDRFVDPKYERVMVDELLDALLADQERNRAKDLRTVKIRISHLRAFFRRVTGL